MKFSTGVASTSARRVGLRVNFSRSSEAMKVPIAFSSLYSCDCFRIGLSLRGVSTRLMDEVVRWSDLTAA